MAENSENSDLFRVVNFERVGAGYPKQYQLDQAMNRQPQNFWKSLKKGTTKFDDVAKICDLLGLELIIRNPKTNTDHKFKADENEATTDQLQD